MLFFALLSFVVFVQLFPKLFVLIFAPGFQADGYKFLAATEFLTYVFPYILLISLVAFLGAVQNSKKSFQVVAATPILFNLTLIVFACFSETLSLSVIGTAINIKFILHQQTRLLSNFYKKIRYESTKFIFFSILSGNTCSWSLPT